MSRKSSGPIGLGVLFDTHAERRQPTVFHLSRPLDMAPWAGTRLDIDALADLVAQGAGWLHAAGARPGQRVAISKTNHWDYVLLACAAARIGAIPAMVSGLLPTEALQTILKRLEPAVLVTDTALLAAADRDGADLTSMATRTLTLDGPAHAAITVADVRGASAPAPRPRPADQPMIATHTSGTTGISKLVVHSANTLMGHLGRTESIRWPIVGMKRNDTVATSIAFCHVRVISWTTGTLQLAPRTGVIVADSDPDVAERTFRAHPPTYLEALPSTYQGWEPLTVRPDNVFRQVRLYVSTFDAVHPPTVRSFLGASQRRFPTWLQGWGQSETGPMTFRLLTRRAVASRGDRHPTTRNVGRPIPGFTALRVVDPATMRPVSRGTPGVVLTRTNGRCLDYVGESDRWQVKAVGPWWNTGDVGVQTRTGGIRLLDREVDVIPGLSCIELEDVLADRMPGLLEAVIIGVPGRAPLPVLCAPDGIDRDAWRRACHDLPELADPVVLTWDEIPRTGTGKVRRQELRDRLLGAGLETYGLGTWT
ncbi:MAG TPA: class I adenylate-forming enzyme family protein [Planosporangium sp.]|nr:class I adenylate-forming enzyme family protein [Planosporangium sp.]